MYIPYIYIYQVTPEDVSALEALRDALLMTELDNAPGAGAAAGSYTYI